MVNCIDCLKATECRNKHPDGDFDPYGKLLNPVFCSGAEFRSGKGRYEYEKRFYGVGVDANPTMSREGKDNKPINKDVR